MFRDAIRRVQLNAVESGLSDARETYLSVYELMTWMLYGMVKGKVCVVDVRERTDRGVWKGPEHREKVVD